MCFTRDVSHSYWAAAAWLQLPGGRLGGWLSLAACIAHTSLSLGRLCLMFD